LIIVRLQFLTHRGELLVDGNEVFVLVSKRLFGLVEVAADPIGEPGVTPASSTRRSCLRVPVGARREKSGRLAGMIRADAAGDIWVVG
jgi:hypothetical protein